MLFTNRTYLTPITCDDTSLIIKWRNKAFVRSNFIYQKEFTKESHERWLETMVDTGKVKQFIIRLKVDDLPVGSVYLRDIDTEHLKAEYGIFIGEEDYLGKGIGTEVAAEVIRYAFEELKLHKIMLRVLANNPRAIESYKKAGFIEEGIFKDDVRINGRYYDIIFMSVITDIN